jgi:hypothetical protein
MSDHFYDGQLKRYITQFIRVMSNFSYKNDKGQLIQVPARYGDMTRQVAQIINKNSENAVPSAPFISCYIKDLQFDRPRMQDPTFVDAVQIRDRVYNEATGRYTQVQGAGYTVERVMPSPYLLTFNADIWSSNTDQKFQLWEQISVLFNPGLEFQNSDNYLDWSSLSVLMLDNMIWSSRQIPQGLEQDIDILTMSFKAPIWITPPAKVKQLGIITKIIANVHAVPEGTIEPDYADPDVLYSFFGTPSRIIITPGNFDLLVLDNTATLVHNTDSLETTAVKQPKKSTSWNKLLDLYPGQFRAGLSQIRLTKSNGLEIVAYITLSPKNEKIMLLNIDPETIPANSTIGGRTTIDAIINPHTFDPSSRSVNTTYLILESINPDISYPDYQGPIAWRNSNGTDFYASANDIIQWDGSAWNIVFDSTTVTNIVYITNAYTGIQYKWDGEQWMKSFEGVYSRMDWRLIL